jgi:hypothetical protein
MDYRLDEKAGHSTTDLNLREEILNLQQAQLEFF